MGIEGKSAGLKWGGHDDDEIEEVEEDDTPTHSESG